MKSWILAGIAIVSICLWSIACTKTDEKPSDTAASGAAQPASGGQENVKDDDSMKDVVKIAVGSPDHTTLVTALKTANLVTALSNAGPFTVFAPVNAAFDKLPKGTVETLLKPENNDKLTDILYHHVITSAIDIDGFTDGQTLTMFDGKPAKITKKDGTMFIDDAKVVASVRGSNGWVHVVDGVVLAK
jgi:uncharacterized surface protein with fasciclin (FAS1) repeats